jgi:hypothetical protein
MPVLKGVTTYFEQDPNYNIPCNIKSWYLSNNLGSATTVKISVYDLITLSTVHLFIKTINAFSCEFSSVPFILLPSSKILISSDTEINFYISIE